MIGSKMGSKGRVTIPKRIRERLALEPGDRVLFQERAEGVVIIPVKRSLRDFMGSVQPRELPENFNEVRGKIRRRSGNS